MRIITLEEHFLDERLYVGLDSPSGADGPDADLRDLGEHRIAGMDRHGISMQVLSSLATTGLPAGLAVPRVRAANDRLAGAVAEHPDRFAGFAALPTSAPEAAADELARAVTELGFVGTLIMGRTDGEFLGADRFEPILARAEQLDVPLYLHPGPPPPATYAENYGGFAPAVSAVFGRHGWGWHNETAVHFLNLVLAGGLDRHPDLQIVLGHWGEMIPFYLDRLDWALPRSVTGLRRTFTDYLREQVYLTPSGMFTQANLRYCIEVVGVERIMYAVDYPFVPQDGARDFLDAADLTPLERELVAHGTAERVLGIPALD